MKRIFLLVGIALFFGSAINVGGKAEGAMFPNLSGTTLSGNNKTLPKDVKGKFTLLALAYSSDAENDLQTWMNPVYNKFIAKTGMFDSEYDVNLYLVPMFRGSNKATANGIVKRMKNEIDESIHDYVLFYNGSVKEYKEVLGMDKKDLPYLFLLDETGKIIFATSGQYSESKMEEIEDQLTK